MIVPLRYRTMRVRINFSELMIVYSDYFSSFLPTYQVIFIHFVLQSNYLKVNYIKSVLNLLKNTKHTLFSYFLLCPFPFMFMYEFPRVFRKHFAVSVHLQASKDSWDKRNHNGWALAQPFHFSFHYTMKEIPTIWLYDKFQVTYCNIFVVKSYHKQQNT